jgi:hypothetical protein
MGDKRELTYIKKQAENEYGETEEDEKQRKQSILSPPIMKNTPMQDKFGNDYLKGDFRAKNLMNIIRYIETKKPHAYLHSFKTTNINNNTNHSNPSIPSVAHKNPSRNDYN